VRILFNQTAKWAIALQPGGVELFFLTKHQMGHQVQWVRILMGHHAQWVRILLKYSM
jgi:hypothetical protein